MALSRLLTVQSRAGTLLMHHHNPCAYSFTYLWDLHFHYRSTATVKRLRPALKRPSDLPTLCSIHKRQPTSACSNIQQLRPALRSSTSNTTSSFLLTLPLLNLTIGSNGNLCSVTKHKNARLSIEINAQSDPYTQQQSHLWKMAPTATPSASAQPAAGNVNVIVVSNTQHIVPVDGTFETGMLDGEILCGDVQEIVHGPLLQLMAKYDTKVILEMLVELHKAGASDDFKVLATKGLDARVTKAFRWASKEYGFGESQEEVHRFRERMFNPAALANGRAASRNHAVEKAQDVEIANAADLLLTLVEIVATDDEDAGSEQ